MGFDIFFNCKLITMKYKKCVQIILTICIYEIYTIFSSIDRSDKHIQTKLFVSVKNNANE